MAQEIKPPTSLQSLDLSRSVFLAGSINMGEAEDWQTYVSQALQNEDISILNPRRDAWDATWVQRMFHPQFREQVIWELEAQEKASMIIMYFVPTTQSPVTLLELGLFARSGKLLVCCPDGFWRKGNVEIVCHQYQIPMLHTLDKLVDKVREKFRD